jgi:ketosteroid isomerase-like protein
MYATIVSHNIRASWRQLNNHNCAPVLQQLAPKFRYVFLGNHALSGERHSKATLERFFGRVFRLFPDANFEVREVLIKGMPWNTTAVALVNITAKLPNGQVYRNEISQTIRLRWGKIIEIRTLEETQALMAALQTLLESGVTEAGAAPIEDTKLEDTEPTKRF